MTLEFSGFGNGFVSVRIQVAHCFRKFSKGSHPSPKLAEDPNISSELLRVRIGKTEFEGGRQSEFELSTTMPHTNSTAVQILPRNNTFEQLRERSGH